tara:strand:- start:3840 stop:5861 length:2022 start_codon:yes stop_codon:yes gene_type:complete
MNVVVKKKALLEFLTKVISENRSAHSLHYDETVVDDSTPVQATPQMSVQLSSDAPPVDDPEYIPAHKSELALASSVISHEVPDDQIEFFYRMLHKLLDASLDRHEKNIVMQEAAIANAIDMLIENQNDEDEDDDDFEYSDEDYADDLDRPLSIERQGTTDDIVDTILSKNLHLTTIHDPSTGKPAVNPAIKWNSEKEEFELGEKEVQMRYSSDYAMQLVDDIISRDDDVARMIMRYARENSLDVSDAKEEVADAVSMHLDKGSGLSPDLAAEMKANIFADEAMKASAGDEEKFIEEMDKEISSTRQSTAKLQAKISGAHKIKSVDISPEVYADFLEKAKEARLTGDVEPVYEEDFEFEIVPEEISDEERAQIERDRELKNIKKLDGLAPYFGFKNASGIRQWRRKFAEPKFKALLGSLQGYKSYKDYAETVFDNMSGLLDGLEVAADTVVQRMEAAKAEITDNKELAEMLDEYTEIRDGLREIQQNRDQTDEEELDVDLLLSTDAGKILRIAFSQVFFDKEFRDLAKDMKTHMVSFLSTKGISEKAVSSFAKMFNGEVDLVVLNNESANGRKLISGGVTKQIYYAAIKEADRFTSDFFSSQRVKISNKRLVSVLRDQKKLRGILGASNDELAGELARQAELMKAMLPKEERDKLDEISIFKKALRGMIISGRA